jgi:hypothetical protein
VVGALAAGTVSGTLGFKVKERAKRGLSLSVPVPGNEGKMKKVEGVGCQRRIDAWENETKLSVGLEIFIHPVKCLG